MRIRDHYNLMARYNQWMNEAIYKVCEQIPDERRKQDQGAFFRSIHGTLNHILWGDHAWLGRFTGQQFELPGMGQDLFNNFSELSAERKLTDARIVEWLKGLGEEWLSSDFSFTSVSDGKERTGPAWIFVSHMFNHQTHHRGQVTTLVKQLGYEPPVTDIPWMSGLTETESKDPGEAES